MMPTLPVAQKGRASDCRRRRGEKCILMTEIGAGGGPQTRVTSEEGRQIA